MSDLASRFGGGTAEPDPLQRFLQRVVAWSLAETPDSYVNIHGMGGTVPPLKKPMSGGGRAFAGLSGLWDAAAYVRYLNSAQTQVFFSLAAAPGFSPQYSRPPGYLVALRKGIVPRWMKAFGLDLDVKPGAYPSQEAARAAALAFLDGLGLKHGPVVNSGAGVHVYVTLDQPIPPERWRPLAAKLAAAAKAAGLHFDQTCTVNAVGLWRMPTSTHRKDPNNPREVRVIDWGEDTTVDAVEAALAGITTGGYTAAAPQRNGIDLSFLPPRSPITGPEAEQARADTERAREATSFDLLRTACAVVADSEQRGGNGDIEPLWFELGKLMRFVQHGREWFHILSKGDGRYEEDKTDQKYDGATSSGWPRCATIASSSPKASAICQRCPYLSLNQTPIHHARNAGAVPPPHGVAPDRVHVNGHAHGPSGFSAAPHTPIWLPPNYGYDNGVIITPNGDRPFLDTPILDIALMQRSVGKAFEHVLQFQTLRGTNDADDTNTFPVPMATIASRQKLTEALAEYGVKCCKPVRLAPGVSYDPLETTVTDVLTLMRQKKLALTETRQGWTMKDGTIIGFAYGGYLFTPDGRREIGSVNNEDYMPAGLLTAWREAANAYVGKGCTAMEVVIAASLAAPLVQFTTVNGLVVFTYSANTGKGKSAALYAGATVWARPKSVLAGGTEKGAMSKMYAANNLPFCFDELIPDKDLARQFGGMVKAVTAGIEDAKLYRNSDDRPQRTSRTLLNANSNRSLVEVTRSSDTNAQAARVFEFEMPDDAGKVHYSASQTAAFRNALERNYGVGGLVVAEYLGKNYPNLEQVVSMVADGFQRELEATDAERFWLAFITADYMGAYIGKATGLFDFDLPAIKKFLFDQFRQQRTAVLETGADADAPDVQLSHVFEFMNDNTDRRLVTEHLPRGSAQVLPMNMNYIRGPAAYRWAKTDGIIWISESKLKVWCKLKQYSYDHMHKVLGHKDQYWRRVRDKRRLGSGCMPQFHTQPEVVLEIDLANPWVANLSPPEDETGETNAV